MEFEWILELWKDSFAKVCASPSGADTRSKAADVHAPHDGAGVQRLHDRLDCLPQEQVCDNREDLTEIVDDIRLQFTLILLFFNNTFYC